MALVRWVILIPYGLVHKWTKIRPLNIAKIYHEWNHICTTKIRNKILTEWCLPQVSVLRYENKIEFKSFFAFVALYFMAWFNRLGLWKIALKWPFIFHKWHIFWRNCRRRRLVILPPTAVLLGRGLGVAASCPLVVGKFKDVTAALCPIFMIVFSIFFWRVQKVKKPHHVAKIYLSL